MTKEYMFYQCDKCRLVWIDRKTAKEHNKIYNHTIIGLWEDITDKIIGENK